MTGRGPAAPRRRRRTVAVALGSLVALLGLGAALGGCGTAGYVAQSVQGHLSLMHAARPVPDWVADPSTPPPLRERLALSQRMRDFAVRELALPDNASYRAYADLRRPAAVWNVVAAPELSLKLHTWCFPVMGCVGYRGYFDRAEADALAAELKAQGSETLVYGVPAYSTLGWLNWLGGDPLLNTFVNWPEGELARLIFHELAHQVAYAPDDTMFNESYATAVERLGARAWLERHGSEAARRQYAAVEARRADFRALVAGTRTALEALYASDASAEDKRAGKARLFEALRAEHRRLKAERWDGFAGFDAWFAGANNAAIAVQAAYNALVPAFERLYEQQGRDFARFHAEVRRLAALPKAERRATLAALPPT